MPHIIALSARRENFVQRLSDVRVSGVPICDLHGRKEQINDFCVLIIIDQTALTGIFF